MKRFRMRVGRVGRAVLAAIVVVGADACDDDPQSHVYVAAPFDPAKGCFDLTISLGEIETADGDLDCAPTCLVLAASEVGAAAATYVSTMCGPYPAAYDTSQTDPSCIPALAAWPAEQQALANGTDSCASVGATDAGGEEAGGASDDGGDAGNAARDAGDSGTLDAGADDGGPGDASGAG